MTLDDLELQQYAKSEKAFWLAPDRWEDIDPNKQCFWTVDRPPYKADVKRIYYTLASIRFDGLRTTTLEFCRHWQKIDNDLLMELGVLPAGYPALTTNELEELRALIFCTNPRPATPAPPSSSP